MLTQLACPGSPWTWVMGEWDHSFSVETETMPFHLLYCQYNIRKCWTLLRNIFKRAKSNFYLCFTQGIKLVNMVHLTPAASRCHHYTALLPKFTFLHWQPFKSSCVFWQNIFFIFFSYNFKIFPHKHHIYPKYFITVSVTWFPLG